MSSLPLILASRSPRRLDLLRLVGLEPRVRPANVVEAAHPHEPPEEMVRRLAEAKARHVSGEMAGPDSPALVLAADTAVVLDGEALGKPRAPEEAGRMLLRLRGRVHEVLTAVFLLLRSDGRSAGGVATTRVRFRRYGDAVIREYVASGEPLDKAGAYGIQGRGARLVERFDGSWSNVVGLPLELLPRWTRQIGVDLDELRAGRRQR